MKAKVIIVSVGMLIGAIALHAEVFNSTENARLRTIWSEKNAAKAPDAVEARQNWTDYIINSELNDIASDNHAQLAQIIPHQFTLEKISKPTAEQIDAKIAALWKADYDPSNHKDVLKSGLYSRYMLPEAIIGLGDEERFNASLWSAYHRAKQYEKALAIAVKYERWQNAMTTATAMKDRAKIFEFGRKTFLDTYVATPAAATSLLTNMLKPNYDDVPEVTEENIADFLVAVSKRYPAPNADVEAWKGFMGYVGYRYKSLTGNDLFKK